jgi:hypothetical protein
MRRNLICLSALLLTALLGCASKRPSPPLERPYVHRIAVVPATDPPTLSLENRTGVMYLAPIVGIGTMLDSKGKAQRLNQDPKLRSLGLANKLTRPIVDALRRAGYEVEVLDALVRPAKDPDDIDLDKLPVGADAILQLRVRDAGLYSGAFSNDYVPRVNVDGKLVARGGDDDIYDERLYYGVDPGPSAHIDIQPDLRHAYPTFDALMDHVDEVGAALQTGTDALAQLMAQQLLQALAAKTRPVR